MNNIFYYSYMNNGNNNDDNISNDNNNHISAVTSPTTTTFITKSNTSSSSNVINNIDQLLTKIATITAVMIIKINREIYYHYCHFSANEEHPHNYQLQTTVITLLHYSFPLV